MHKFYNLKIHLPAPDFENDQLYLLALLVFEFGFQVVTCELSLWFIRNVTVIDNFKRIIHFDSLLEYDHGKNIDQCSLVINIIFGNPFDIKRHLHVCYQTKRGTAGIKYSLRELADSVNSGVHLVNFILYLNIAVNQLSHLDFAFVNFTVLPDRHVVFVLVLSDIHIYYSGTSFSFHHFSLSEEGFLLDVVTGRDIVSASSTFTVSSLLPLVYFVFSPFRTPRFPSFPFRFLSSPLLINIIFGNPFDIKRHLHVCYQTKRGTAGIKYSLRELADSVNSAMIDVEVNCQKIKEYLASFLRDGNGNKSLKNVSDNGVSELPNFKLSFSYRA
ncbi:hypothetical protein Anas_00782 [Armadillidium nasatum]|uniref:Uncharacterized protein n=1 Tax=Armadillidium nasatum TaxID=96803 RepID=A0A5N5SV67_9CRUS|nr:hypothetical protein Anas_00782 [Armadillidium nasatum]